jgi:hypothetical protein
MDGSILIHPANLDEAATALLLDRLRTLLQC